MYPRIARCREHNVDPRTYLQAVPLRVGKVGAVRDLTAQAWKQRRTPLVEAHRASIPERLVRKLEG